MQYAITFLEGILSFLSPCMLPMLPVYLSYFAGREQKRSGRTLLRAAAFVLGFTVVFCALGLFAGTVGAFLTRHRGFLDLVCGSVVILMGLSYLGVVRLPFFSGAGKRVRVTGLFSALLLGMVYSLSLTPCVGAFLGSALMLAGSSGTALQGTLLLLTYSLGLGLPFLLSAVLLEQLRGAFAWVKRHYGLLDRVCGGLLIVMGLAMATGRMGAVMAMLS